MLSVAQNETRPRPRTLHIFVDEKYKCNIQNVVNFKTMVNVNDAQGNSFIAPFLNTFLSIPSSLIRTHRPSKLPQQILLPLYTLR